MKFLGKAQFFEGSQRSMIDRHGLKNRNPFGKGHGIHSRLCQLLHESSHQIDLQNQKMQKKGNRIAATFLGQNLISVHQIQMSKCLIHQSVG